MLRKNLKKRAALPNSFNCPAPSVPGGRGRPPLPAVLMLGAGSQVGQVLLLRELLMVFHGNELSIGLILASWLAWVGVGSRIGAVFAGSIRRSGMLLLATSGGLLPALLLTILLIRHLRGFFELPSGALFSLPDMLVSCFLIMGPVCFLLGMQFVLLTRLWRDREPGGGASAVGKTYVFEAAGNVLGGIVFTFFLVRLVNAFQAAALVGLFMLLAAILTVCLKEGRARFPVMPAVLAAALAAAAVLAFSSLDSLDAWAHRAQWSIFSPRHQLVDVQQSKHGAIAVLRLDGQYSFFQSGQLIFTAAGPETATPELEEQEAVEFAHLAMVQHPDPKRVLLMGGGLRGLLGELVRYPVKSIDYIELDETLMVAALPYVSPATAAALTDDRVRVLHTDGRLYVKTADRLYDIIIVDIPDPVTAVLNRYYTAEFYSEAAALLRPGGVLAAGAVSSPGLRGRAVSNRNATIYHSMKETFGHVAVAGEHFMFYFAAENGGQVSLDPSLLQARYLERGIEAENFSPAHFHNLLQESRVRQANWVVKNHGRDPVAHLQGPAAVPLFPPSLCEQEITEELLPAVEKRFFINRDFRPVAYFYSLMFWDELTRDARGESFARLLVIRPWWVGPLLLVPLLGSILLRLFGKEALKRAGVSLAVLYAVFTTGLSTMALQVALLFSFQSIYGFVYETVGLIVAAFMAGLALGAFLVGRCFRFKVSLSRLALVQLAIALATLAIAFVLPASARVDFPPYLLLLFFALTFFSGLINGVDFPLSAACYSSLRHGAEKTAGTVYGVELAGACLGSVLAGVVIVPIFGIASCCYFAALVNGSAFLVLLTWGRDTP